MRCRGPRCLFLGSAQPGTWGKPAAAGMRPSIPCKGEAEVPAAALSEQRRNPGATFQHGYAAGFQMPFLFGACIAFCLVDEGMSVR